MPIRDSLPRLNLGTASPQRGQGRSWAILLDAYDQGFLEPRHVLGRLAVLSAGARYLFILVLQEEWLSFTAAHIPTYPGLEDLEIGEEEWS